MLNLAQTIAVIVAALASAYAVGATEYGRRLEVRRGRVERVLDATIGLADAAIRTLEIQGQGAGLEVARRRLRAELQIVGITGFESTELMVRPTATAQEIADQSEAAFLELGERLDELTPQPLFAVLIGRRRPRREIIGGLRL